MIVNLRSGNRNAGRWMMEKRNIKEDIKRYFKSDISFIEGIAVMTDTDNSQSAAVAYYGDISFSTE